MRSGYFWGFQSQCCLRELQFLLSNNQISRVNTVLLYRNLGVFSSFIQTDLKNLGVFQRILGVFFFGNLEF